MLPDEPKGWRKLQEKAKQEKDPKKFAAIIDEMNRLLAEREKAAEGREKNSSEPKRRSAEE
jgi:23S rRNA maturation mini-RNase III